MTAINEELAKDISDAIEKNLPAASADLLIRRLSQGREDAKSIVAMRDENAAWRTKNQSLAVELDTAKVMLAAHVAIGARETAVAARELRADFNDLQTRHTSALENTRFARDLALGLVRNTDFRESVFTSSSKGVPVVNGGCTSVMQSTDNETVTKDTKAS